MRIIDPHLHIDRMKGKDAETLSIAGVEAGILPTPHILQWLVSAETLFRIWRNFLDFEVNHSKSLGIDIRVTLSVPFYGGQPSAEEAAQIKAPLLLQYAGLDTRVNEGWPAYETTLKANNIEYTVHFYPDVNHGFHNNTTPRFDKEAADLAWSRTIAFFKEKLK